jgi:hypothetical protein
MNNKLYHIQQKIDSIQFGLLRLRDDEAHNTWQVKTTTNEDNSLNCIITDDSPRRKLVNKNVNLIQKYHDDYLYITGTVDEEVNTKSKILSIRILKACWFVRKSKGGVSWLQEKYIYENYEQPMQAAS